MALLLSGGLYRRDEMMCYACNGNGVMLFGMCMIICGLVFVLSLIRTFFTSFSAVRFMKV